MFSGVHGSATHEQRPHLSVVSASSGEVLIGPALLSHVDGLTDFLSMLPGVFFNLLASIWLRPESDPPFDVLVDVFHEVLVFIARRPVELVEGLDGREVLVKGELGGFILMVLVHNTDHGRQHFDLNGIVDQAGLERFGLVCIKPLTKYITVEGCQGVALEVSRPDGSNFRYVVS